MNLKLTLDRLKASNPEARITQGTISSENLLSGASQVISWNVKDNKSNPTVNDVLLRQSDAFCVTAMSIQLRRVVQAGATATNAEIAQGKLYTYANTTVFPSTESGFLQTIYNGNLVVTINKNQVYTQFPGRVFEFVPPLQQGQTTAAVTGPTTYTASRDAKKAFVDGFCPLWPTINLQGAWDINFTLNLPASVALNATGNFSNYATLILDGYVLQNAAKYSFPE